MPVYRYSCTKCDKEKSYFLSIGEEAKEVDCPDCDGEFLKKILTSKTTMRNVKNVQVETSKSRVEEFIRHSKEDLKSQKEQLKGRSSDV